MDKTTKKLILIITVLLLTILLIYSRGRNIFKNAQSRVSNSIMKAAGKCVEIERVHSTHDEDRDGIDDFADIVEGARKDAANKPEYKDAYYRGGYPPETEGVCTDVIWRAFKNAGYNLKDMVDEDIKENTKDYWRIVQSGGKPDPNIDFRRVPNLVVFFDKYAENLTTKLIPGNAENLKEWQGGDIVVFGKPFVHIGIISDKRRPDGVPYIIHNGGPYTQETDELFYWMENISRITNHYRWIKK